jgi:hypothetical protein
MPKKSIPKTQFSETEKSNWLEEKQREKDKLLAELEAGVKDIFESGKFEEYLNALSKFHNYSIGNVMRIERQKPEASIVAGFNTWKEHGRYVKSGEKGLKILAPHFKSVPQTDKDGNPIFDTNGKQITKLELDYFTWKYVFDISQTDGKPFPELVNPLNGNVENYNKMLDSLIEISPVPVSFEDIRNGSLGFFNKVQHRIAIQKNMNEPETLRTLIHEISHAHLHNLETGEEKNKDRRTREVQAESVAFVVCKHFGIDTGNSSFGYIAGWSSDKEYPQLKESLNIIRKYSDKIINDIDEKFLGIENKNFDVDKIFDTEKTEQEKFQKGGIDEMNYNNTNIRNSEKTSPKYTAYLDKVEQARNGDLLGYFQSHGYEIQKQGSEFYIKSIKGLCINPSKGTWFSHYDGSGGHNSIDCLTKVIGLNFKEAVTQLSGYSYTSPSKNSSFQIRQNTSEYKKEVKQLVIPERADNNKRVIAYLTQTRKIPKEIVYQYIKADKIYQDKNTGNAVFPHTKNGKIVGAELQGTLSEKRFKGIAKGTGDSIFAVTFSKEIKKAYIFESTIDLMSFHAMLGKNNNLNGVALISMAGLKPQVIKTIQRNGVEIFSCVDNDEKGRKFETDNNFPRAFDILEKVGVKDWNDLLKANYALENSISLTEKENISAEKNTMKEFTSNQYFDTEEIDFEN